VSAKSASSSSSGRGKAKAVVAELPEALVPAFEALRAWRAEQAREQGVPAYVIFHDATLREIVTVWPTSVAQLGSVGGVGEKKLATYGEGVIGVLAGLADGGAATKAPGQGGGDADADRGAERGADPGEDPGADHWPEMDADPEPEDDWI
jgi:ATP-dependent DNA helicase RecQ